VEECDAAWPNLPVHPFVLISLLQLGAATKLCIGSAGRRDDCQDVCDKRLRVVYVDPRAGAERIIDVGDAAPRSR
jgi:hypothetical protein